MHVHSRRAAFFFASFIVYGCINEKRKKRTIDENEQEITARINAQTKQTDMLLVLMIMCQNNNNNR